MKGILIDLSYPLLCFANIHTNVFIEADLRKEFPGYKTLNYYNCDHKLAREKTK